MFPGGRQALWEEKLGLAPKFAGNAATRWGTRQEADALLRQAATQAHAQTYCMDSVLAFDGPTFSEYPFEEESTKFGSFWFCLQNPFFSQHASHL